MAWPRRLAGFTCATTCASGSRPSSQFIETLRRTSSARATTFSRRESVSGLVAFWGRGFTQGTQNQFEYLRVKHSDFIFSVLAEELGFVGALVLFGLFIFLIFRLVRASERARDPFGRLVAFGVACMLFFQSVVNLGANLTVLPVTGIPLPLVSFGGSALITNFVALGLVQSILVRRLKYRY